MERIHTFKKWDVRPLLRTYYTLWVGIIVSTLALSVIWIKEIRLFDNPVDVLWIKSGLIFFFLIIVPAAFGYYTLQLKQIRKLTNKDSKLEVYGSVWHTRTIIIFILLIVNDLFYFLTYEKSLLFVLIMNAFVYLYCKPSINTMNNELNEKVVK
jgi:hypothetical protein